MWNVSKSILCSKTFWTAVAGAVLAALNIAGYTITTEQADKLADLVLFIMTGVFRFMATQELHVIPPAAPPAAPPISPGAASPNPTVWVQPNPTELPRPNEPDMSGS